MPVTRIRFRTKPDVKEKVDVWLFVPTSPDARFEPDAGSIPWPRAEGVWGSRKHLGTTDCDEHGVTTTWDDDEITTLELRPGDQLQIGMRAALESNRTHQSYPVEVTELEVL